MKKIRFADLFAGIGGTRIGFEKAGEELGISVECVFSSEIDKAAIETYQANFGDEEICGDITKLGDDDISSTISDFDVLLAGFPCQPFSHAGKKLGFTETRGTLFFDIARILKIKKPSAFLLENVKGLATHRRGDTLDTIINILNDELEYDVRWAILNAKNFGVPQNRERVIIVGFRKKTEFSFPKGKTTKKTIADILEEKEVSPKYYLSDTYLEGLRNHRRRHEKKGHGFGFEIKSHEDISNAIVCGGMGRERNLLVDNRLTNFKPVTHIKGNINREFIRRMTPREWARLQGFSDDFIIPVADTQAYKQFANSVPVPMIKAVSKELLLRLETDY